MNDDYGLTNKKAVLSGSVVEIFEYDNDLLYGVRRSKPRHFRSPDLPSKSSLRRNARDVYGDPAVNDEIRAREILSLRHRTRSKLIRLCATNAYHYYDVNKRPYRPALITFTFKEDIRDLDTAHKLFQLFIKRFNYQYNSSKLTTLKYLAVPEFQDKTRQGVIHYHVLFFNMRFVHFRKIEQVWAYGSTNTKKAYRMRSLGNYLTKYLVKNFNDTRMDGRKRFFCSKGLFKPSVHYYAPRVDSLKLQCQGYPCKPRSYKSVYYGNVLVLEYTLPKDSTVNPYLTPSALKPYPRVSSPPLL